MNSRSLYEFALPDEIPPRGRGFGPDEADAVLAEHYDRGERVVKAALLSHCLLAVALTPGRFSWPATAAVVLAAAGGFGLSSAVAPRTFLTRCVAGVALQAFVALHLVQLDGSAAAHTFYFTSFVVMIACLDRLAVWPAALLAAAGHVLAVRPAWADAGRLTLSFGLSFLFVALCGTWAGHFRHLVLREARRRRDVHRLALISRSTHNAVVLVDRHGRTEWVNDAFTRLTGYAPAEVVGTDPMGLFRSGRGPAGEAVTERLRRGETVDGEFCLRAKGDRELWVTRSVSPVVEGGQTVGYVAILSDVTERRKAQAALRESEERYKQLFESVPIGLYRTTPGGRVLLANAAAVRMAGCESFDRLAAIDLERDSPCGLPRPRFREWIERDGEILGLEVGWTGADGRVRFVRENARVVRGPGGRVEAYEGTLEDVTERKLAEDALRLSEARYQALFESNPFPLWVFDTETFRFLAVNRAAVGRYGYSPEEFHAMTIWDIRPPEEVPALRAVVAAPSASPRTHGPWRHVWKDGTVRQVEVTTHDLELDGRPARLALVNDVTDRARLEEELRQAQRMEAVGQLAGGVAHDFNNLLTVVLGNLDRLRQTAAPEDLGAVDAADRAARRAAELTRQLLGFARRSLLRFGPVRLDELAAEVLDILRRVIDPRVRVTLAADPAAGPVRADAGQIEQVLMNLCLNARDAMPDGGELAVGVGPTPGGGCVRLTVRDTGEGMTSDVAARAFEPFFTTKEVGKGTGLGLAMVYGIVRQHQGRVACDSAPGAGTTFTVDLPRWAGPEPAAGPGPGPAPPPASPAGRTVLVIDDEEMILALAAATLRGAGYRVLTAADGRRGVDAFRAEGGRVDLVVLDLTMPVLSGRDALAELAAADPAVKVLLSSGYSDDSVTGLLTENVRGFLAKPYRPAALLDAVARALARPPAV